MTSGGNNFRHFPKNQLNMVFAYLFNPTGRNATVSPFPLSWYHLFGETAPSTTPLPSLALVYVMPKLECLATFLLRRLWVWLQLVWHSWMRNH